MNDLKKLAGTMLPILLLVIICAGCATPRQHLAFDKAANNKIKTIGIIARMGEPDDRYRIIIDVHAGSQMGLLGAGLAIADMEAKTKEFTALVKEKQFNITAEFQNSLAAELQGANYNVKILKFEPARDGNNYSFIKDYSKYQKDVDAYLEVVLFAGYRSAHFLTPYLPSVQALVLLVDRQSGREAYYTAVSYGYFTPAYSGGYINVRSQDRVFADYDEVTQNIDNALTGLRTGIPFLAQHIAADLQNGPGPVALPRK